jgi:hypothetical protein
MRRRLSTGAYSSCSGHRCWRTRTPITLELGGVLLSSDAVARHQDLRSAQYVVDPAHPLQVTDVDGARGVTVVAGAVAAANAIRDPRTLPRYPVGAQHEVTLRE